MRLGRDFTNCLLPDYLGEEQRKALLNEELDLPSANAMVLEDYKKDVLGQLKVIDKMGMNHLELDSDPPNPYLDFTKEQREEIRETAESMDITLSLHLPYTYIGASLCCFQESDRKIAAVHSQECAKFAADIGAIHVVTHPGKMPFYQAKGKYREQAKEAVVRSLAEIYEVCKPEGVNLHLENNVAFDNFMVGIDECIELVRKARDQGTEAYFNFDIGHWFTRADAGGKIPDDPVEELEDLPEELLKELHLNDYVPEKIIFHPPLHLQWGPLKREVLERYAKIVEDKRVETIVLETALKNVDQFRDRDKLLEDEAEYVREIFGV